MCSALLHREELMSASRIPLVSTEELHRSWRTQAREIDIAALEKELQKNVEGEVRFDAGSKALYAADASNYRQVPIGVVIPKSREDVVQTVAASRKFGAPVLSRGGGTSLAGQCCNVAVVIDWTKYMHQILELNQAEKYARVLPGPICDRLRNAAKPHTLTWGPDPATHNHCTFGGMLGNNSCGAHAQMAGKAANNVHEMDVLLYDGTQMTVGWMDDKKLDEEIRRGGRSGDIYSRLKNLRSKYSKLVEERYPHIPRRVSGYNLDQLIPGEDGRFNIARALVGSESTLVTILEAKVRLMFSYPKRLLLVLGYPSVYESGDHVPEVLKFGPIALEGLDERLIDNVKKKKMRQVEDLSELPEGKGWLVAEFGAGTKEEAEERAREAMKALQASGHPSMKLYTDEAEQQKIWEVRESGLGATAFVPGEPLSWPGWEDSAVAPDKVGDYLRDLRKLYDKYQYNPALYGHFGQGCIHCRVDFDLFSEAGIRKWRSFMEEATDLVTRYDGSLSGEHGDGQGRAEFLYKMFGNELIEAFREFKAIWDPDWKMNPGKVVDPYPLDTHLRMDPGYRTRPVSTDFRFPADDGSFAAAAERCFGVGACRDQNAVMCPSYQVTLEEKHSTRGRARLLFEMMRSDSPLEDGWRNEEVKEALDLCLACKGCLHECPVRVDMATYKAEFLSHYYHGRLRPRQAYLLGLIRWEARLAAHAPRLANLLTQRQPLAATGKRIAGIAPERRMPAFAPKTFKQWWRERSGPATAAGSSNGCGPASGAATTRRVVLWADTFNDHFHPEVAVAATEVLEAAGFTVAVPARSLCCGRPLYDYGMLGLARRLLHQVLDGLREEIRAGTPVVALEPSCGAVFRNELTNMLPDDEDAKRLARQTHTLGEFLAQYAGDWEMPRLERKALVHFHCHQRATSDTDCDQQILDRLGLD